MGKNLVLFVLISFLISCQQGCSPSTKAVHGDRQEAVALNNKAYDIVVRNVGNRDSLSCAIKWYEKSIAADSTYVNAYLAAAQYLIQLYRDTEALKISNCAAR